MTKIKIFLEQNQCTPKVSHQSLQKYQTKVL